MNSILSIDDINMSQRITQYIRENYGEEILKEIVEGKRTVSINDVIVDGTAKNFRDKRVTETSRVIITPDPKDEKFEVEQLEILPTKEEIITIAPEIKKFIEETEVAIDATTEIVPEVLTITQEVKISEANVLTSEKYFPTLPDGRRTKKFYPRLSDGKWNPKDVTIFTSPKGLKDISILHQ